LLLASTVNELSHLLYVLKAAKFNSEQHMTKCGQLKAKFKSKVTPTDIDAVLKEAFEINATS